MARIAGVDLPRDKRVEAALPYIYGIGLHTSQQILERTSINPDTRVRDAHTGAAHAHQGANAARTTTGRRRAQEGLMSRAVWRRETESGGVFAVWQSDGEAEKGRRASGAAIGRTFRAARRTCRRHSTTLSSP